MALATITDLKKYIPSAHDNDYWNGLLTDAIAKVKNILNRDLESTSRTQTGWTDENGVFYAKEIPITAITSLTVEDSTLTLNETYEYNATTGRFDCDTVGEYSLVYTGGETTIPETVKIAIAKVAQIRHQQLGVGLSSSANAGSQSVTVKPESELMDEIKIMLDPYINKNLGWITEQEFDDQI